MGTVIRTEGLSKTFGTVHTLADLDLEVFAVLALMEKWGVGKMPSGVTR